MSTLRNLQPCDNWYYKMFTLKKTKKVYSSPRTNVAEVDLEGLICTSGHMTKMVDELHNINSEKKADGTTVEPLYFEF